MKKILTVLAALVAFVSVAQAQPDVLSVYTSPTEVVKLNMFSHMGYGFHFVTSDDFKANTFGNGEFFLNVLKLDIRPTEYFQISLGADLAFNHFHASDYLFYQTGGDAHLLRSQKFSEVLAGGFSKQVGYFGNFFLGFPLLLKANFDGFSFGAGAEANLNLTGHSGYRYKQEFKRTEIKEERLGLNLFNYGIIAMISYSDVGLYFKYYPSGSRILPGESLQFKYWTLGICVGL